MLCNDRKVLYGHRVLTYWPFLQVKRYGYTIECGHVDAAPDAASAVSLFLRRFRGE